MINENQNTIREFENAGNFNTVLVAAGEHIYDGNLVGINDGYARAYQAGDTIAGFAQDEIDNTTGADGDASIKVRGRGKIVLEIDGVAQSNIGAEVYITSDATFAISSGSYYFGKILRIESTNRVVVAFDAIYALELALGSDTDSDTDTDTDTDSQTNE